MGGGEAVRVWGCVGVGVCGGGGVKGYLIVAVMTSCPLSLVTRKGRV